MTNCTKEELEAALCRVHYSKDATTRKKRWSNEHDLLGPGAGIAQLRGVEFDRMESTTYLTPKKEHGRAAYKALHDLATDIGFSGTEAYLEAFSRSPKDIENRIKEALKTYAEN